MHFPLLVAMLLARTIDGRKFELVSGGSAVIDSRVSSLISESSVRVDSECLVLCQLRGCAVAAFNSTIGFCQLAVINDASSIQVTLNVSHVTKQLGSPGDTAVKVWRTDDFDMNVLNKILEARNMTRKRLHIPYNSVKVFAAWLQHQSDASSIIDCFAKCSEVPACRGVLFDSSNCSLLTDHPLCRWFQQPPSSDQLAVYDFYTAVTQQCFETVDLRVSDQLSFDRLWAEYRTGFGTYHDNYFAGLEWLHTRISAQPSNRFRVDLLYWNETYIYGYYVNVLIQAESTNYTISAYTFQPGNGLADLLFNGLNLQFQTRDRGLPCSSCPTAACPATYNQPHWFGCCHNAGPFGKYFNYPTALNVPASDRAKGIVWALNAPTNITDGFYYSFKQLEILMLT